MRGEQHGGRVISGELTEAYEVLESVEAPIVLSCEHATNRLPPGWTWPLKDAWLVETHWAFDLGIADVTRELATELGAPAVLSRFSRLLIDPNRDTASPTLFRDVADGRLVQLNRGLPWHERQRRLTELYMPFHQAFGRLAEAAPGADLLSLHSFTPIYEGGPPRPMEIGILFDREDVLARALANHLSDVGWVVALNKPYSGQGGNMYSVDHHAMANQRRAIELELRQDVTTDPARRERLVTDLAEALRVTGMAR